MDDAGAQGKKLQHKEYESLKGIQKKRLQY